jgi:Domain of unknown function (DUF5076)
MNGRPGELDVSDSDVLDGSHEFARLWYGEGGLVTCIIEPRNLEADPFVFGLVMVDCIKHGAKAYSHALGIAESEALERIFEGFDVERANPSDQPYEVSPTRKTN